MQLHFNHRVFFRYYVEVLTTITLLWQSCLFFLLLSHQICKHQFSQSSLFFALYLLVKVLFVLYWIQQVFCIVKHFTHFYLLFVGTTFALQDSKYVYVGSLSIQQLLIQKNSGNIYSCNTSYQSVYISQRFKGARVDIAARQLIKMCV